MQKDDDSPNNVAREKAIYRYVRALDESDLETVAAILDSALHDADLDAAIIEINLTVQEEEQLTPSAGAAEIVRSLLRKHLAHTVEADAGDETPVTVAEVAARLKSERRVPFTDQEVNDRLLTVSRPLPAWLSIQAVKEMATELGATATERYWRAFRDAAIMLNMARSHRQAQLAAAREERIRNPERIKPDKNKHS
jgi:hypothetical protein